MQFDATPFGIWGASTRFGDAETEGGVHRNAALGFRAVTEDRVRAASSIGGSEFMCGASAFPCERDQPGFGQSLSAGRDRSLARKPVPHPSPEDPRTRTALFHPTLPRHGRSRTTPASAHEISAASQREYDSFFLLLSQRFT